MSQVIIVINTDNAAFDDGPEYELARVLEEMADRVRMAGILPAPRDINGNIVGTVEYRGWTP